MQFSTIGATKVSRFGVGTKRMPTTDASRVVRIDNDRSHGIVQTALATGVNYVNTSYSDRKGEAEAFLGEELAERTGGQVGQDVQAGGQAEQDGQAGQDGQLLVATSYFELVDPRYEYVFQKQLKKLQVDCIDFYFVESVCDMTRMRDIDSGAVDFLFEQREAGKIAHLGFSSELSPDNLKDYLRRYPWDFVRLRLNYYDWFLKGAREQYVAASELSTPIVAHGALRVGPRDHLKPEARAILSEANPDRSTVDWALRFVKSLPNVRVVTCNVSSEEQLREDAAVFQDEVDLDGMEMHLLGQAARKQQSLQVHRK